LPLSPTYLIGCDLHIELAAVDVDYRHRLDPQCVLDTLVALTAPT